MIINNKLISEDKIYNALLAHVPQNAVHYCFDLWKARPFEFKLNRSRSTKLGDYRYDPRSRSERISVNRDLNPYSFLITYLHEVAHQQAYHLFGRKIQPHGKEWKSTFSELLEPVITDLIFPEEILEAVKEYKKSPKATSSGHHGLAMALNRINGGGLLLAELEEKQNFQLGKRIFQKGKLRRTRYLCQEVTTGKIYLISKNAIVKAGLS